MPLIRRIEDDEAPVSAPHRSKSLQDLGDRIASAIPELRSQKDIGKILEYHGADIETLVEQAVRLMHHTDDEKIRRDLILEFLNMHGVRKPEDNTSNTINLIIKDGNVEVQNILMPKR